jgi:hypothetical protein
MTRAEKMLYHQIHPLKLAADISSCVASCALLWQRQIGLAMLVAFVPAIVASWIITTFVQLERLQESAFGHYVSTMMTPAVTAQRMAGQVVMWYGAYKHETVLIVLGSLVVVLAWLSGIGRASSQRNHVVNQQGVNFH